MRALFQIVIFRRIISKIIIPNQTLIRNNDLISYELFSGNLGPVSGMTEVHNTFWHVMIPESAPECAICRWAAERG